MQYVELHTSFDSQQFFVSFSNATRLISKNPSNTPVGDPYFFPSDSSAPTAGHHLLVGTSNLASVAGVTPDFILPADFVLTGGGIMDLFSPNWGTFNSVSYPALPGGTTAYHTEEVELSDGTPTNYAGTVGSLPSIGNDGDYDDDNDVDADDIDILWHIVRQTGTDPNNNDTADLNNDTFVNEDDVDFMLAGLLDAGTNMRYGDANLSGGTPELTDYNRWRTGTGGWAGGDFDGSGGVPELNDYNLWRTGPTQFPGTVGSHGGGGGAPLVPEPATIVLAGLALPALLRAVRRRRAPVIQSRSRCGAKGIVIGHQIEPRERAL